LRAESPGGNGMIRIHIIIPASRIFSLLKKQPLSGSLFSTFSLNNGLKLKNMQMIKALQL